MGSKGHQADLNLAVPALSRLLEERSDLMFEVFGTIRLPSTLLRFGRRVRHIEVKRTYMDFLLTLAGLGWDIGLAPLVDTPFNRCKAPTKYIEYSACNIPVVASNMPVYSQAMPEGAGELAADDWYERISRFLDHADCRQHAITAARAYCSSRFSVNILTHQVRSILNRALNEKRSHAC
jgi:glycosyltransferase involved in cell wall biosynthesis